MDNERHWAISIFYARNLEGPKKGLHVRGCRVFTANKISEKTKKKDFVVRDEAPHFLQGPHFLRGSRFQPAEPIRKFGPGCMLNSYRLGSRKIVYLQ